MTCIKLILLHRIRSFEWNDCMHHRVVVLEKSSYCVIQASLHFTVTLHLPSAVITGAKAPISTPSLHGTLLGHLGHSMGSTRTGVFD